MEELDKWKLVNGCQTKEELCNAVDAIAGDGIIVGNTGIQFNAAKIKKGIDFAMRGVYGAEVVTRAYGIRQQMLYLMYYGEE